MASTEFSLWRKDGVGNRYAVSRNSHNAVWVPGYLINDSESHWRIEGDPEGTTYTTGEDAARVLIERDSRAN
jgi:hypothetical protein